MNNTKGVLIIGGTGDIGGAITSKYEPGKTVSVGSAHIDLLSLNSIDDFFNSYEGNYFEIFIFSSAINNPSSIAEIKFSDYLQTLQINCNCLEYIFSRNYKCLTRLKSFVAIGSLYSDFSRKDRSSYAISKHALYGFVKSLAIEGAEKKLTANLVSPGFIDTKLTKKNNSEEKLRKISAMIPLKELGTPEDIAHAVHFLTQEGSAYISGINLIVDGGLSTGGFQGFLDE
ncbi:MAG: 3-oxoacyl-[acyl-carrier protein] reductase [Patiriisocius sp.]|jgi:3-oxoacyl-[acyl-carrier protein] reductase